MDVGLFCRGNSWLLAACCQTNHRAGRLSSAPVADPSRCGLPTLPASRRASTAALLPLSAASVGRRIAVAYNSFAVGRGLLQFARDKVLTHRDTVYICHVFSNQNPVSHCDKTARQARHFPHSPAGICTLPGQGGWRSPAGAPRGRLRSTFLHDNFPRGAQCRLHAASSPQVVKETIKFMRAVTLQKADSLTDEVTRDNSIQVDVPSRLGACSPVSAS